MKCLQAILGAIMIFAFVTAAHASSARFLSKSYTRTFGAWEVSVVKMDRTEYIRLASYLVDTPAEFEILINYNRYWDEERVSYQFYRLVEPGVYQSPEQVKKVGSFALDEVIYPVDMTTIDPEDNPIYTTLVNDPPDYFLRMLDRTNTLQFRFVNGIDYIISMLGFREALAYARELEQMLLDRCRHLLPRWRATFPVTCP